MVAHFVGLILGLLGYIGIMEKKMETTVVYWGNIGRMENKMETTMAPRDSGKEERFIQFLVACNQHLDALSTHIGTNVSYRSFKMGNTFASLLL